MISIGNLTFKMDGGVPIIHRINCNAEKTVMHIVMWHTGLAGPKGQIVFLETEEIFSKINYKDFCYLLRAGQEYLDGDKEWNQ